MQTYLQNIFNEYSEVKTNVKQLIIKQYVSVHVVPYSRIQLDQCITKCTLHLNCTTIFITCTVLFLELKAPVELDLCVE